MVFSTRSKRIQRCIQKQGTPSQKDDSLRVSVCMLTCTSSSSHTIRHESMAAGVVPQSCCDAQHQLLVA